MIVLNAGVPRSGTVLVNGMIRGLLRAAGVDVTLANAHGPELPATLRRAIGAKDGAWVIHTHSWDADAATAAADAGQAAAFGCHRDPRDVCVSLMRLHDHDRETAARMTYGAFVLLERMRGDLDVALIAYADLIADPAGHIRQIAGRLGVPAAPEVVAAILADTDIARQRTRMEQVRAQALPRVVARRNSRRVLLEDPETLINDRHIQSGAPGRWRTELGPEDQAELNRVLAPAIERFGYPAD